MPRGRPPLSAEVKAERARAREELRARRAADDAPTGAVALVPVLRSEGQRMLLHVSGSLQAIANEIGARSAQSVLDWRNGKRMPAIEARAAMASAFGIPIEAWSMLPAADGASSSATTVLQDPNAPLPSTLDACMQLLQIIQRDRNSAGLLPAERVKLADAEARILKLRAELERHAELSEDRYVRDHPAWHRVRKAVAQALLPYPEAARAVADALERLEV